MYDLNFIDFYAKRTSSKLTKFVWFFRMWENVNINLITVTGKLKKSSRVKIGIGITCHLTGRCFFILTSFLINGSQRAQILSSINQSLVLHFRYQGFTDQYQRRCEFQSEFEMDWTEKHIETTKKSRKCFWISGQATIQVSIRSLKSKCVLEA